MITPRFRPGRRLLFAMVLGGILWPASATAQVAPVQNGLGGLIIADRARTRALRQAEEMVADQKYVDALALLQALLERDQDQLLRPNPNDKDGAFRSLKTEIQRIIGSLPPDGRGVYLRNNSPMADRLLKEAITENDEKKLAQVARRYFHTPAGYEATYRIGMKHFDHGEPMAAALIFQRLRRTPEAARMLDPMLSLRTAMAWIQAGMPIEASVPLRALKASHRDGQVMLSSNGRPIFKPNGETSAWLAKLIDDRTAHLPGKTDWLFPRGTLARNPVLPIPEPEEESTVWNVPTDFFHPDGVDEDDELVRKTDLKLQAMIPRERDKRSRQTRHLLPSHRPVVVNGIVLSRMLVDLRAYDLKTGTFFSDQMMFSWDVALESLTGLDFGDSPVPNADVLIGQWLDQRVWEDQTNGSLSTDGKRLFVVEETGFWTAIPAQGNREAVPVSPANVLTAFDLDAGSYMGRMIWDVGGIPLKPPSPPRYLEGRFFLGPPLPLAGQLFCLSDYKNEVQLNVLKAASGELEWSQPLAAVSQRSITQDRARRTSGISPAYADGILVCPTGAGATVGLDLTTRSLLWGFPTDLAPSYQVNPRFRGRRRPVQPSLPIPKGWVDSTPTISSGKVVLTPLKSAKIYLLDLRTGKRIWDHARGDGLYVAGVVDEKAIVVGQKSVGSWNLNNDRAGFDTINLTSAPTGRGVIVGNNLLLPAGKSLLVVDLLKAREVRSIPAPREIDQLGNLVVAEGRLISQSTNSLSVFAFPELD